MALSVEVDKMLKQFVRESRFAASGGVVTDLDGTAVHEEHERIYIPEASDFRARSAPNKIGAADYFLKTFIARFE